MTDEVLRDIVKSDVAEQKKLAQTTIDMATKPLHARIEALEDALRLILAEPYGCPMCDSGKLRGHKSHWDACGFGKAQGLM